MADEMDDGVDPNDAPDVSGGGASVSSHPLEGRFARDRKTGQLYRMTGGAWSAISSSAGQQPGGTFSTRTLASPVAGSPTGARSLVGAAARTQALQEKSTLDSSKGIGEQMQLLHNLAVAGDLVSGPWDKTPTGAFAGNHVFGAVPGTLEMARMGLADRVPGIPSTKHQMADGSTANQVANLGQLDKTAAASALVLGQGAGGTDKSREMAQSALFGIDKDQGTNQRNIDNMMRQTVYNLIDRHAQNYFMNASGDLNAVDPKTGMSYAQFMSHMGAALPTSGYGASMKLPRSISVGGRATPVPDTIDGAESDIEGAIKGAAAPPARAATQAPAQGRIPLVQSDDDYVKLPIGAQYMAPGHAQPLTKNAPPLGR